MDTTFIKRLLAWLAAIYAILGSLVLTLTPLVDTNPWLAKIVIGLGFLAGIIAPFLPRAQGNNGENTTLGG